MGFIVTIKAVCDRCGAAEEVSDKRISAEGMNSLKYRLRCLITRRKARKWAIRNMGYGTQQVYCDRCMDLPELPRKEAIGRIPEE